MSAYKIPFTDNDGANWRDSSPPRLVGKALAELADRLTDDVLLNSLFTAPHQLIRSTAANTPAIILPGFNTLLFWNTTGAITELSVAAQSIVGRAGGLTEINDFAISTDRWFGRLSGDIGERTAADMRTLLGIIEARKPGDESLTADTNLQNDDDLKLAIAANENAKVYGLLTYTSNATADLKVSWTFPAGATLQLFGAAARGNGGSPAQLFWEVSDTSVPWNTTSAKEVMWIAGHIQNGGTAGDLQFRWAQNFASGTTTVHANSMIWKETYD